MCRRCAAPQRVRHNRPVPPRSRHLVSLLLGAALGAAGCGVDAPGAGAGLPLAGDGNVAWQGVAPCADCDAIETRLWLAREGGEGRYRLEERFIAAEGGQSFAEEGGWRLDDGVLALEGSRGARRHFAVLADGRLRVSDAAGDPLRGDGDGDLLVPVAADPL